MRKFPGSVLFAVALIVLVAGGGGWWWRSRESQRSTVPPARKNDSRSSQGRPEILRPSSPLAPPSAPPPVPEPRSGSGALTAAQKAARVEQIKRDYDELATKLGADFAAQGAQFPGGLNAYLRQLALLEREKRQDFAALLSPPELEELELRETPAGKLVAQGFADTAASEEQRRAVFRLQLEFDDKYALVFDLSPTALWQRQAERAQLQEKIFALLGSELSGAWLRTEGPTYAKLAAFVQQQGLRAESALELWRVKTAFALRELEIAAKNDLPPDARALERAAAAQWARDQAASLIGPGALQTGGRDVFGWLPGKAP